MAHHIEAVVLKGKYLPDEALQYDLKGVDLGFDLTLFFIDKYFAEYWQKKLQIPGYLETNCRYRNPRVIFELMKRISMEEQPEYATILTAYVGGMGDQYANVYQNDQNADLSIDTISDALRYLGVLKGDHLDEFDAVRLGRFRSNPDYLHKYEDMLRDLD